MLGRQTDRHQKIFYFLQQPSSYSYRTQRDAFLTLAFEEEALLWTHPTQQCLVFFLSFLRICSRAQVRVGRGKKSEDTNLQFTQKLANENATIATLNSPTGLWVLQLLFDSYSPKRHRGSLQTLPQFTPGYGRAKSNQFWGGYVANDRRSRAITTGVTSVATAVKRCHRPLCPKASLCLAFPLLSNFPFSMLIKYFAAMCIT